jgi:hypothetical protein
MSQPDSSDVDAALVGKLQADTTLAGLMPGGVFVDEAPAGSTQHVIVSLIDGTDVPMFGGRAIEDGLYLVKAVELSTVAVKNIKAAAARIDVLLDPQPPLAPATLAIAGYGLMVSRRVGRVRQTEVDDVDSSIRWQHRGGRYQLMVAPVF